MKIRMFQVDAFTKELFGGNPAAVCVLEEWLPETTMQAIAAENNLAETAFILETENYYEIRWFTPVVEVELCGHATLAAAHIVFHSLGLDEDIVEFYSEHSGLLIVRRDGDLLSLDFPADNFEKVAAPAELIEGLGIEPMETYKGKTDLMAVLPSEQDVLDIVPDFELLSTLDVRGIIVTAAGSTHDFVCRFFGPAAGINEDPVTGSAYTTLTPYWAKELGKDRLTAVQLSKRRGHIWCTDNGARIDISGYAVTYMQAEIEVPVGSVSVSG